MLGPERRRQDVDGRDARGLPPPGRRARCGCSGSTRRPTTPRSPAASASCSSAAASTRCSGRAGCSTSSPATTPTRCPTERAARPGRPARRGHHALAPPLGRRAAAALAGPGPDRPARGGLPRRADGRRRPRGPRRHPRRRGRAEGARASASLLTTHELGEAERMADRIVILSAGRVVLEGTPHELTADRPAAAPPASSPSARRPASTSIALAAAVGPGTTVTETAPGRYRVEATGRPAPAVTAAVATFLAERGAALTDLVVGRDARGRLLRRGRRGRGRASSGEQARAGRAAPLSRRRAAVAAGSPASTTAGALRPLTAQTGAEIYMTLRRGETLLLTLGIPVVFLLFFSKVSVVSTPTATPANFFVPGHPGAGRHVDRHGLPRHRHRLRARLRRAQAPRRHPARPPAPPRRQDRHRSSPSSCCRLPCSSRSGSRLGWNPGGDAAVAVRRRRRRHPPRLGRLRRHRPPHGRHAAGRGQPGRGQRPLPGPPAPRRHDRPDRASSRAAWPPSPSCCRPRRSRPRCTPPSAAAPPVPAESWVVLAVWAVAAPVAAALTFRWE